MQLGYRIRQRQSIFFCFDWANRPLCSSVISIYPPTTILPPYHHPDDDIPLSYSSPGQRRNCLGRDVRRLETSDKMNGSTFHPPPREKGKNNDDDILEGNASIHHVFFFFFFFHVHLHGNVTWSFNRSSFILTTFIPPFLFFSVWPIFQMIGGKWCGFIFKVDWMPLASITESNRAVAVGHRALCQEPKRLSYNTLDYNPQSLTKKTIDRFVPSFLSSRPISDKVRRFKFHPFSISLKNHWIQIYSTSNVSSSQPVRYWNSSLRHQLELLTSP